MVRAEDRIPGGVVSQRTPGALSYPHLEPHLLKARLPSIGGSWIRTTTATFVAPWCTARAGLPVPASPSPSLRGVTPLHRFAAPVPRLAWCRLCPLGNRVRQELHLITGRSSSHAGLHGLLRFVASSALTDCMPPLPQLRFARTPQTHRRSSPRRSHAPRPIAPRSESSTATGAAPLPEPCVLRGVGRVPVSFPPTPQGSIGFAESTGRVGFAPTPQLACRPPTPARSSGLAGACVSRPLSRHTRQPRHCSNLPSRRLTASCSAWNRFCFLPSGSGVGCSD